MENIEARKLGFEMNELPKTFRDAITVTRALSIRYLWIDSLCIIQDDRRDWDIESTSMSRVYSQSYLTIAATLASNDSQGFLGSREDHVAREHPVIVNGKESRFYVRQKILHDDSGILARNPLFTRAWAFQELLISPRIVCFTQSEMMWHCLQVSNCECDQWHRSSPALLASKLQEQRKSLPVPRRWNPETSRWTAASVEYRRWYEMIEAYTQLQLTLASDRLPALAALSQRFQGTSTYNYAAGLWRGDLLRGLLWQASWEVPGVGNKPFQYRAPSWSWASVDAKVIYDRSPADSAYAGRDWEEVVNKDENFKILKVSCRPRGLNPYGEVVAGHLSVSGRLATANLHVPEIQQGGDETRARYVLWPSDKDKPEYSTRWPPLNNRGFFRPDVPLMPVSHKSDVDPEPFITAERSHLQPGSARSAFSCRVFGLFICHTVILVLAPSQRHELSYERLGPVIMDDDMSILWQNCGTIKKVSIV